MVIYKPQVKKYLSKIMFLWLYTNHRLKIYFHYDFKAHLFSIDAVIPTGRRNLLLFPSEQDLSYRRDDSSF